MTATTAIAIRDDQTTFDDLQTRALSHLGVETASPADLAVFFHHCKRTGLDPFARQIYMIRRDGKQTIQTSIDGLRLIAARVVERTGEKFGYSPTYWCGDDGVWRDVWLSPQPPAAARVSVLRNGEPFPAVVLFSEFVQRKRDGAVTAMWKTKAAFMLGKCAEAAALRKAFPQELSGIYSSEELRDVTSEVVVEHQPPAPAARRVTAADFTTPAASQAAAEPQPGWVDKETGELLDVPRDPMADKPADPAPVEDPGGGEWKLSDTMRRHLFAAFTAAGFDSDAKTANGRKVRLDYISGIVGRPVSSSNELTHMEAERVIRRLEENFRDVLGSSLARHEGS